MLDIVTLAATTAERIIETNLMRAPGLIKRLRHTKLRIVVYGNRATGKTTVVGRLCGRAPNMTHAPTVGQVRHNRVKYQECADVAKNVVFTTMSDLGGEPSAWKLWDDEFTRIQPNGIIFVVDSPSDLRSVEAMRHFIQFLGMRDRRWLLLKGPHSKARDQVKAVMFLYNKSDVWQRSGFTIYDFMNAYNRERMAVEQLVPTAVLDQECSALTGANFHEAMAAFITKMVQR